MNVNLKDTLTIFNVIVLLLGLFLGGFVWADSNGVWNNAKDLRGGIIGADEQVPNMNYTFLNLVIFKDKLVSLVDPSTYFINISGRTQLNDVAMNNLNVNNLHVNGSKVATLDSSGKVPTFQLPFHKGDLLAPANRLTTGSIDQYYFDITNLDVDKSSLTASKVAAGTNFGLNANIVGTFTSDANAVSSKIVQGYSAYVKGVKVIGSLSSDSLCSSAGGTATCGATSNLAPGSFYAIVGSNSPTNTNYCDNIGVSSTGSVSSNIIQTAGICKYISSCSSSSQSISNYADGTNCGTSYQCQGGSCVCVDSSWSPSPSTICSGSSFTQTSNCGNTRIISGTKSCITNVYLSTFEGCGLYCGYSPNEGYYILDAKLTGSTINLNYSHVCRYPSKCGGTSTFSSYTSFDLNSNRIDGDWNSLNGGSQHSWKFQSGCLYIRRGSNWNNRVGCFK